jgi:hypothetical protein
MRTINLTICLIVLTLCLDGSQVMGLTQFKDGQTHNIGWEIPDDVWVDYKAPNMNTTVNLLNGGSIPSPYTLQGFNNSRLNVSGGSVNALNTYNTSHLTMSGGNVNSDLYAHDNSQITMSGGVVSRYLFADDSSQITISGGTVYVSVNAYNNGQITISGGSLGINGFHAYGNGRIDWSGGTLVGNGDIQLDGFAVLALDGSNFAIDGVPFVSGEITSILGGDYSNDPFRRLTGTLAKGDIINNQFRIGNDAKIVLVPEPATLLLLGFGAVLLRKKR